MLAVSLSLHTHKLYIIIFRQPPPENCSGQFLPWNRLLFGASLVKKLNHSEKLSPWSYEPLPEVALWTAPALLFLEMFLEHV